VLLWRRYSEKGDDVTNILAEYDETARKLREINGAIEHYSDQIDNKLAELEEQGISFMDQIQHPSLKDDYRKIRRAYQERSILRWRLAVLAHDGEPPA